MNRLRAPLVRGYMLWAYRRTALRKPVEAFRYLLAGRELTNLTYEIANVAELVDVLVVALAEPREQIEKWLEEVTRNDDFLTNLTVRLQTRRDRAPKPLFGRRLGWYCALRSAELARGSKPVRMTISAPGCCSMPSNACESGWRGDAALGRHRSG
jgi:hypothetical protein